MIKTREIFNFLPLINNSVTIGLRFLLTSISAVISLNAINIDCMFVSRHVRVSESIHTL